jgi:hypothetical protein
MSRRGNTRKRLRQRKRHEERKQLKQRQATNLLTQGLIAALARPISSRGAISEAIQQQERT